MITAFEIGRTYYLDFADGERAYFTPTERWQNGNYKGLEFSKFKKGQPHKPKQRTVSVPLIAGWKEAL